MARTKRQKAAPLRHPLLEELRGVRIGPAFPNTDLLGPVRGMRAESRRVARGGKDTKAPFRHGRQRARRAPDAVTATCLSCRWTASGRHWRPVRRLLAEHVGKKHPKLAEAS